MELQLENETVDHELASARKHLIAAITADEDTDIASSAEAYLEALNHRGASPPACGVDTHPGVRRQECRRK